MTRIGLVTFLSAFLAAAAPVPAPADEPTAVEPPASGRKADYEACMKLAEEDPAKAKASADAWAAKDGGAPAEHCLAVALIGLGRHVEAAKILERLADDYGPGRDELKVALLAQAGQAWFLAGVLDRAGAVQTAALDLAPRDVDLLIDRSLTLAAGKLYWGAIDDLNEANALAPTRSDILIYRASAYRLLESYGLAMEDIQAALLIDPKEPVALLERGNLYRLTGEDELARDDWARVIALAPASDAAGAARENLRNLETGAE